MSSYKKTPLSVKRSPASAANYINPVAAHPLPLVVTLNCIEDYSIEQESLSGVANVEHVPLSRLSEGKIESAAAVLLHSLAFLPRAAQRRLRPYQLILCLGSTDRIIDSTLGAELGLRLVHVDASRAEEVADTVMALFLGLLRRTHLLSRHSLSASGWLGSVQPVCRGMRRCRGLVLGIIGRSASARALATRSLAFRISVLYFDVPDGKSRVVFPPAARKMDTLNDLLAASDLISLHCAVTNETVQIINADCLQHVKPGAFLVNTGSSQLLDDCAVKQMLTDGTLAGCALDGAEGPQWMEAWVRELPNVIILPRSADYSEEVWMEIREKAISVLQAYFYDGIFPTDAFSEEEEESEVVNEAVPFHKSVAESSLLVGTAGTTTGDNVDSSSSFKKMMKQVTESTNNAQPSSGKQNLSDERQSRSVKKAKKRHGRHKGKQHLKGDNHLRSEKAVSSHRDDDAISGTDQAPSSGSRFGSPEDLRSRKTSVDILQESISDQHLKLRKTQFTKSIEMLKDGCVIALYPRDRVGLHVARHRVKGGGWYLDVMSSVSIRDPAAQFLVIFRNKDTVGLRSFGAEGKLLQINRRMEFVFASHSFDVWECWTPEGSLDEFRLVNCRNPLAVLDARIEILAAVGEDGITRWLE